MMTRKSDAVNGALRQWSGDESIADRDFDLHESAHGKRAGGRHWELVTGNQALTADA